MRLLPNLAGRRKTAAPYKFFGPSLPLRVYDVLPEGTDGFETARTSMVPKPLGAECNRRGCLMTFAPVMWTIWGVLVAAMAALHVYRSNLMRDEEDQVFLDDSFEHEKSAQAVIAAKVNKVEPVLRIFEWSVAVATVLVILYYIWQVAVVQLHLI